MSPTSKVSVRADLTDYQREAWSWAGKRFKYTGSSSDTAIIKANDIGIIGSLSVVGLGVAATYSNQLRLFDATTGEYVDTSYVQYDIIVSPKDTGNDNLNVAGEYDTDFNATLTPNHTYVVFVITKGFVTSTIGTGYINQGVLAGAEWGELVVDLR